MRPPPVTPELEAPAPAPQRGLLATTLYAGVTASLVWLLLRAVDFQALLSSFVRAETQLLVVAFLLNLAQVLALAARWQLILRRDGVSLPFARLFGIYFESMFFGLFLPSSLGGDIFRGASAVSAYKSTGRAATGVLVERMIGVWGVCLLALVVLPFVEVSERLQAAFFAISSLVAIGSLLLFAGTSSHVLPRILRFFRLGRFAERAEALATQSRTYLREPKLFSLLLGLSILQQLVSIVSTYTVGEALGLDLSLGFYVITMPVVWVLAILPALGGLGPREAALFFALTSEGVPPAEAVALGALAYGLLLARGLAAGVVFFVRILVRRFG